MTTTQTYETFFHASPEQVWDAISKPEHTERYFFGTRVSLEPKAGGTIAYQMPDGSPIVEGEVKSITPGAAER